MRILALALVATLIASSQSRSEIAFRIAEPDLIPEGIAYDPQTRTFFVGSTFKRKIVAVDRAGKARDFVKEGRDGIFGVVGMRVDVKRRMLWAISAHAGSGMPGRSLTADCLGCSTVTRYDVATGRLLKKYSLPAAPSRHFLNDLTIAPSGDVYITDTGTSDLYRIAPGKDVLERWINLGAQVSPNGIDITPDGKSLFVATQAGIRRVDIATGAVTSISSALGTIDGLYFFEGSLIAIQPFDEFRKVAQYRLAPGYGSIAATDTLEASHPSFKQPTTGVIVGRDFFYIANSQLQAFRAIYRNGEYDRSTLSPVLILKTRLTP